jgi:hypothetical protein
VSNNMQSPWPNFATQKSVVSKYMAMVLRLGVKVGVWKI